MFCFRFDWKRCLAYKIRRPPARLGSALVSTETKMALVSGLLCALLVHSCKSPSAVCLSTALLPPVVFIYSFRPGKMRQSISFVVVVVGFIFLQSTVFCFVLFCLFLIDAHLGPSAYIFIVISVSASGRTRGGDGRRLYRSGCTTGRERDNGQWKRRQDNGSVRVTSRGVGAGRKGAGGGEPAPLAGQERNWSGPWDTAAVDRAVSVSLAGGAIARASPVPSRRSDLGPPLPSSTVSVSVCLTVCLNAVH